jgi:2-methylisocitrate lyase-like PEP mutase family enzyme
LLPVEEQVAHIAAIRAAVPSLVINARVDVFVNGSGDVDEAVERGNAYLRAGADGVYPILCPTAAIAELTQRIDGPINVLVHGDMPDPSELQALGVARMTWGGGLAHSAYAEAARIAAVALSGG